MNDLYNTIRLCDTQVLVGYACGRDIAELVAIRKIQIERKRGTFENLTNLAEGHNDFLSFHPETLRTNLKHFPFNYTITSM